MAWHVMRCVTVQAGYPFRLPDVAHQVDIEYFARHPSNENGEWDRREMARIKWLEPITRDSLDDVDSESEYVGEYEGEHTGEYTSEYVGEYTGEYEGEYAGADGGIETDDVDADESEDSDDSQARDTDE